MTTYVLSELPNAWRITRIAEEIIEVASGLPDEESALALALEKVKVETPSQVLRIGLGGDNRVVARFPEGG